MLVRVLFCVAGVWFNLGVAGMAGECFIRVGPVWGRSADVAVWPVCALH